MGPLASGCVPPAVLLAPLGQREQRRTKGPAIIGQRVFGAENGFVEDSALHQAVFFKLPKLGCEDLLGGLRYAPLQLTEAAATVLEFAKDQRLPFPRDDPQRNRHRALITQHANQNIRR